MWRLTLETFCQASAVLGTGGVPHFLVSQGQVNIGGPLAGVQIDCPFVVRDGFAVFPPVGEQRTQIKISFGLERI